MLYFLIIDFFYNRSPAFAGLLDCRKTSLKKINGVWGEAPSKVAGAAAPDNKPLPEGKGLGLGIENLFYLLKK